VPDRDAARGTPGRSARLPARVRITGAQARRLALAAQGFTRARPGTPGARQLMSLAEDLSAIQIDSVNVVTRAHYLPAFARLGPYRREDLDALAWPKRRLFEYWAHEASMLPVARQPLLRWRMRRAEHGNGVWGGVARFAAERREFIEATYAEVAERGPISAAELSLKGERRTGNWGWNWHEGKTALEWLFWVGRISTAGRQGFNRRYAVTERVLPKAVLEAPTPAEEEAHRQLLLLAARACGVASAGDLTDYFRLPAREAAGRVAELAADGSLERVEVAGWREPGYLLPGTAIPRRAAGAALICPFDPLIWTRKRARRLFGFDYRVEIYLPAPQRVHGYYVFPFLLGDRLAARVDLKADRDAGLLRVRGAWAEPDPPPSLVPALAGELASMAGWLGLGGVAVEDRGDLSGRLRSGLRRT
jgi:uncharacterized protein YcaQ